MPVLQRTQSLYLSIEKCTPVILACLRLCVYSDLILMLRLLVAARYWHTSQEKKTGGGKCLKNEKVFMTREAEGRVVVVGTGKHAHLMEIPCP